MFAYRSYWESEENAFISEDGTFSHNSVMTDFTEFFARSLSTLSEGAA
jgi:hypothetical protein